MDLTETRNRIRKMGAKNVRVVPMPGQTFDGNHQIEINEGGWHPIVSGLTKAIAENIVKEAVSRVILG